MTDVSQQQPGCTLSMLGRQSAAVSQQGEGTESTYSLSLLIKEDRVYSERKKKEDEEEEREKTTGKENEKEGK